MTEVQSPVGDPLELVPQTSAAEQAVADLLSFDISGPDAQAALDAVPIWFHTFALAPGVYTPGFARDHRYRIPALGPERIAGRRVLDVGTFDGFYAFLAESRGASRVVGVDNEQYVDWIQGRFGIDLAPAAGFDTIHALLKSQVAYEKMDALEVGTLGEKFDLVLCFGMLHRVPDPVGMLRALADVLDPGGEIIVETYGSRRDGSEPVLDVHGPGDVYAGDDFVHWGFPAEGLRRLGAMVGLDAIEVIDEVEIDGHRRIIAALRAAG
ncbi:tRNA U34 carboxymethyltransferase [Paraconexibacter sp. AEG42_29]|uniref:tRNA U34 carboxymethyltransferase n=1 Tax=Paraconexibacter sp. AEG42_29 TaxID=2997339 RepID=A0AAU7ATU8_9ACTN